MCLNGHLSSWTATEANFLAILLLGPGWNSVVSVSLDRKLSPTTSDLLIPKLTITQLCMQFVILNLEQRWPNGLIKTNMNEEESLMLPTKFQLNRIVGSGEVYLMHNSTALGIVKTQWSALGLIRITWLVGFLDLNFRREDFDNVNNNWWLDMKDDGGAFYPFLWNLVQIPSSACMNGYNHILSTAEQKGLQDDCLKCCMYIVYFWEWFT